MEIRETLATTKTHLEMAYLVGSAVVLGVAEGVLKELGVMR